MPLSASIIIGAIAAATSAGAGVASTSQKNIRRRYEQNLQALDFEEKKKLEKQLLEAKSLEERKKLLAETLGKATQTRIEAIEQKKLETKKTLNKLLIIGGVGAVILIVGLIVIAQKRK